MSYTSQDFITDCYLQAFDNAEEEGEIIDLPFSPADVECIHTHKTGHGDGIYFRLNDGRVFNSYGDECETDRTFYDTIAN